LARYRAGIPGDFAVDRALSGAWADCPSSGLAGPRALRQLSRQDWGTALALTMMGNLIYYVCLASAIQRTGAPVSTMIIGTLPVVIPVLPTCSTATRWQAGVVKNGACTGLHRRLVCVNIAELQPRAY
jgi:drug/metabolite transporter (DMT)-like permease